MFHVVVIVLTPFINHSIRFLKDLTTYSSNMYLQYFYVALYSLVICSIFGLVLGFIVATIRLFLSNSNRKELDREVIDTIQFKPNEMNYLAFYFKTILKVSAIVTIVFNLVDS